MSNNFIADRETFWIAHSADHLEHGVLVAQERISTGLDHLETYTDPREWNSRLILLRKDYDRAVAQWLETLRLRDPLAHLADYRWRRETGGVTLTTGARVSSTRESQSQMNSAVSALSLGLLQEPIRWKAESGWLDLTAEQMRQMASEVAAHVSRCFRAEERVAALLATDPALDVEAAFDAEYEVLL